MSEQQQNLMRYLIPIILGAMAGLVLPSTGFFDMMRDATKMQAAIELLKAQNIETKADLKVLAKELEALRIEFIKSQYSKGQTLKTPDPHTKNNSLADCSDLPLEAGKPAPCPHPIKPPATIAKS